MSKDSLLNTLLEQFGPDTVLTGERVTERSAGSWGNPGNLKAFALVRPRSTEEVSQVLKMCYDNDQSVVPHGGLTNVVDSAGASEDQLILSLERMDQIEDIDVQTRTVTVQAGVILQDLQESLAPHKLTFPLDLGAKGSCQIGGNIATNAGGVRVIRYGMTRQLVLGLEVVLADGTILSSMQKVIKDNAGYDLKQLFIGSEGTLGIVTKAVLRLVDLPQSTQTAFLAFQKFNNLIAFLQKAHKELAGTLSAYEVLWNDYYQLMTSPPSHYQPPIAQKYNYYVLLESLGTNPSIDREQFQQLLEKAYEEGAMEEAVIAHTQSDLDWFWGIRDTVDHIWAVHDPVFIFDISLPIHKMETYVEELEKALSNKWSEHSLYVFGHLGDGNLHIFITCGENDAGTRHLVEDLVYKPLGVMGGSISAEHGIGLEKKSWLYLTRSESEIAVMKQLKRALDPKGILNPGKIF